MLLFVFFMIIISSTLMWCAFIPCLCYYYTLLKFWDDSNGFDKYFLFRITWCRKHKTSSNRFFSTWSDLLYRFACVKNEHLTICQYPCLSYSATKLVNSPDVRSCVRAESFQHWRMQDLNWRRGKNYNIKNTEVTITPHMSRAKQYCIWWQHMY